MADTEPLRVAGGEDLGDGAAGIVSDEVELADIALRSRELGAAEHIVVDGRERLYDQFVSYILKANYLRNGVYPSCVGVERMLQAEEVTKVHAVCTVCGATASRSQRVTPEATTVLVGGAEAYEARCRACFEPRDVPRTEV